jgi:hypothetical protein
LQNNCLHCQKQFTPKQPNHLFCRRSHKDQYNKAASWEGFFKRLCNTKERKSITVKFLLDLYDKQNGRCALSGVEMTRIVGQGHVTTNASIDRIRPGKPYTKKNVRLVCSFVNNFRGNTSDKDFVWWCGRIAGYNE